MRNAGEPYLEEEQKELLKTLVLAHLSVERMKRKDFVLVTSEVRVQHAVTRARLRILDNQSRSAGHAPLVKAEMTGESNWDNDLLHHEGLEGGVLTVLIGDLDALRLQDLISFRDDTHFFVTPFGHRYVSITPPTPQTTAAEEPDKLMEARPHPKAFISYTWEPKEHKEWVGTLATRLMSQGVLVTLDQWELQPGDQLPQFMETAVRENDYVLVICTPTYKQKSDRRTGGAGYEGDIMTAAIVNGQNRQKFIPILRSGSPSEAMPDWLSGAYRISLEGDPYKEESFQDLLVTLHGVRPSAPPVGPAPDFPRDARQAQTFAPAPPGEPIKILGVVVDEVTLPRNDGTRGSGLYTVPFQLSRQPSQTWAEAFVHTWDHPPEFSTMHRPGIARVSGSKALLEGTTLEEVEQYHKKTLKLVVLRTNQLVEEHESKLRKESDAQAAAKVQAEKNIRDVAARITFDD